MPILPKRSIVLSEHRNAIYYVVSELLKLCSRVRVAEWVGCKCLPWLFLKCATTHDVSPIFPRALIQVNYWRYRYCLCYICPCYFLHREFHVGYNHDVSTVPYATRPKPMATQRCLILFNTSCVVTGLAASKGLLVFSTAALVRRSPF